ncbi:hypothetical protein HYX16_00350 [Candidatus Woesearchaeota archaeon]|nr:hypothetical protein [Candidatus Woesearchaeota archaeon]
MGYLCVKCSSKHPYLKNNFCPFEEFIRKFSPKTFNLNFLGNTPPDIFIGTYNYPNVFAGIISPIENNKNNTANNPEDWFKQNLQIENILLTRSSMIYSRFKNNVKQKSKLQEVMQEVTMSHKSVDVEFFLEKQPKIRLRLDQKNIPISNPAPLKKAVITENIVIKKPIEKAVYSSDIKSKEAVLELYNKEFPVSHLIKLLSAGLLGIEKNRKLVPTKWSITAVDTLISKELMKNIRGYKWINKVQVFFDTYLENHYEIILLPAEWSFEVIEVKLPGIDESCFWQDFEFHTDRKNYADDVTGAYYANRLAVCEYLEKIKKQASVIVLREIGNYWAPLGVGILREVTRNAFRKKPLEFDNLNEALENIGSRLKISFDNVSDKSILIKRYKTQKKLNYFLGFFC